MESDAVVIGGTLITAAVDDKKAKSAGFGQQYRRDQRPAACLAVLREKKGGHVCRTAPRKSTVAHGRRQRRRSRRDDRVTVMAHLWESHKKNGLLAERQRERTTAERRELSHTHNRVRPGGETPGSTPSRRAPGRGGGSVDLMRPSGSFSC